MVPRNARREKSLEIKTWSATEMVVVASLRDTSTAIDNASDVETIHDLLLEATITLPGLVIEQIAARAEHQPYDQCALSIAPLESLRGLSLTRGYRRNVIERLGGTRGCSHFTTLALELSAANILSIYLRVRAQLPNTAETRADGSWARTGLRVEPKLMNACLALTADSPVQRRAQELDIPDS